MSLNHITSDSPIKDWLNIGANSIRCNSINIVNGFAGDFIPSENLTWDLGSHAKNWRAVYTGVVKDLIAPVEANDAINYVSAQIMTTENSGVQCQNLNVVFPILTIGSNFQIDTIGGYGTSGLLGLGSLPAINGSVYSYKYAGNWSGISGVNSVLGQVLVLIGNITVGTSETFYETLTAPTGPFNIDGTIQFLSGVGSNATVVNTTLTVTYVTVGSLISTTVNSTATCDTTNNINFRCNLRSSNNGGAAVFTRTIGYVTNVYHPSAFP